MGPEECAKKGDAEYFKIADLEVLRGYRGSSNDTILSLAASEDQLECCKEIYNRCPEQLFSTNSYRNTALHHASYYITKDVRVLEFLVNMGAKTVGDIENGQIGASESAFKDWLKMRNGKGETALCRGMENYEPTKFWVDLDVKYQLGLLGIADARGKTPLHWAVEYQYLEIVQLLTAEEPDFNYEADENGLTPLLIAMQNPKSQGTEDINTAVKIRTILLEKQPKQTKVQIGDEGWTALHHASAKGDIDAIKEIIRVCADCVKIHDNKGRNFLHIAVENKRYLVVDYVLQSLEGADTVLNGADNNGNTPLHTAVETGHRAMIESILYDKRVISTVMNIRGEKAVDKITFEYDKERANVYGVRDRVDEEKLKEQSEFDLVVGALIATVSFTAGITVPGGYISDGVDAGMALLSKSTAFEAFVISNTFALVFSLYAVFSHFCTRRLLKKEDIIYQLNVATFCTLSAIFSMMVAFISGSYAVLKISDRIAISVCVISGCFFVFALRAMLRMVMQYKIFRNWKITGFSKGSPTI
ncbi:hypothetical protein ACHQM5_010939 [Ranunculus cassubicifolius]